MAAKGHGLVPSIAAATAGIAGGKGIGHDMRRRIDRPHRILVLPAMIGVPRRV